MMIMRTDFYYLNDKSKGHHLKIIREGDKEVRGVRKLELFNRC